MLRKALWNLMSNKMKKIIEYLQNKGHFNLTALERQAGMPPRTLHEAVSGRRELPPHWVRPLVLALGEIKLGNWRIIADTESPLYFLRRDDETRPVLNEEKDGYIDYYNPERRMVLGELDFIERYK